MLKFLPKQSLVRWALGSVALAGAGSVAYIVIFPPAPSPSGQPAPTEMAAPVADVETPAPEVPPAPAEQVAVVEAEQVAVVEHEAPAADEQVVAPDAPDTPAEPAPPALVAAVEPPPQAKLPAPAAPALDPAAGLQPQDDPAPEVQVAPALPLGDMSPSFDLVRVTDLGDVLIAGRAPARSAVSALIDEDSVADAVSTAAGEFVMMFALDPHPAPRVLELEVRLANGDRVRSADTLMLAPRSLDLAAGLNDGEPRQMARAVEVEPLFPETSAPARPQVMAEPKTAETEAPEIASDTGLPLGSESAVAAVVNPAPPMAVLLRADGGVQVLGPAPELPGAQTTANVTVDSVVYDSEGEVTIAGRTRDGGTDIQIYLDNQPILRARATPDGNWQAQLAGIERGVYRLRVDELDAAAQVTSRAEIPFERVTPEIAREASGPQALIVQPGNTLWAMSRERYGEGRRYMRIFDANRDQIRNPDLIFPGQVFILPEPDTD